jgi:hypothetical protein
MKNATTICFAAAFGLGTAIPEFVGVDGLRSGQAFAQTDVEHQQSERLLRDNNLAPSGETLPHPGASQIGDESTQEKGAQRKSDEDTQSICSNCQ